jgi:hypothetical protein
MDYERNASFETIWHTNQWGRKGYEYFQVKRTTTQALGAGLNPGAFLHLPTEAKSTA